MPDLPTPFGQHALGRSWILRILVVDDDPALRELLKTTFEIADVDLVEAADAAEARLAIAREDPSVIVLDVNMPGVTGLELCRELKDDPATRDIPVIVLTGSAGGTGFAPQEAGARAVVP